MVTDNAANMVKAFQSCCELFGETEDDEESNPDHRADRAEENSDEVYEEENVSLMLEVDEIPSEVQELIESLDFVSRKRVPCAIHTLQLIVLDGLKAKNVYQKFKLKLVACHLLFTHQHRSQKNILQCSRQQFLEQQIQDGIVCSYNLLQ